MRQARHCKLEAEATCEWSDIENMQAASYAFAFTRLGLLYRIDAVNVLFIVTLHQEASYDSAHSLEREVDIFDLVVIC